jgi:CRP/FNR family transcriptional regulator
MVNVGPPRHPRSERVLRSSKTAIISWGARVMTNSASIFDNARITAAPLDTCGEERRATRDRDLSNLFECYKWREEHFRAGQDLFRLGETCDVIYGLVEGWIFRYSLLADGRRQILDFVLPGAVLGLHPEAEAAMSYGARALTEAVVCAIPQQALRPVCGRHPEIGLQLALQISQEQTLSFTRLTSIGRRMARERVAHLMLELFVRARLRWPGHRLEEMRLPLTQEHIGDATGLSGVHVNRVLRDLRKDGIVKFSYRRLSILDPDRLVDVAGVDPEVMHLWRPESVPRPPIAGPGVHDGARHEAA